MGAYILSVAATAILAAAALALAPEGKYKTLLGAAAGCALLIALLKPLPAWEGISVSLPDFNLEIDRKAEEFRAAADREYSSVIADKTSAYIVTKARELGLECEVTVIVSDGGAPAGLIWGAAPDERLSALAESELGIPRERQKVVTDG